MKNCIKNTAKSMYFKHFGTKTSIACIYGIIVLAVLALAFFFWPTLILTIPLLVLPFTFSFLASNAGCNQDKGSIGTFFRFYPFYFKHMFHGGFRGWHALLKCLIVFFASITVAAAVNAFVFLINPEMKSLIELLMNAETTEAFNNAYQSLLNHPITQLLNFISITFSVGTTFYVFLHHLLTNSPKMYFSLFSKEPLPMKDISVVHRYTFPSFRKAFYKDYYSSAWLNAVLFVIGYAGVVTISYFAFANNNIVVNEISVSMLGLAGGFILNLFVMPFTFDVMEQLYREHRKDYALGFISYSEMVINSKAGLTEISDEQRKALQTILDKERDEVLKNFEKKDKKGDNPEDKGK